MDLTSLFSPGPALSFLPSLHQLCPPARSYSLNSLHSGFLPHSQWLPCCQMSRLWQTPCHLTLHLGLILVTYPDFWKLSPISASMAPHSPDTVLSVFFLPHWLLHQSLLCWLVFPCQFLKTSAFLRLPPSTLYESFWIPPSPKAPIISCVLSLPNIISS